MFLECHFPVNALALGLHLVNLIEACLACCLCWRKSPPASSLPPDGRRDLSQGIPVASAPSSMPDLKGHSGHCVKVERRLRRRGWACSKGLTATFKEKLKAMFPQEGRGEKLDLGWKGPNTRRDWVNISKEKPKSGLPSFRVHQCHQCWQQNSL